MPRGVYQRKTKVEAAKPSLDFVPLKLEEADLAPIRARQEAHRRAEADFKRQHTQAEIMRRNIGEIEDLSVPQVVPFDLSGAYHSAALKKAQGLGLVGITNLRKEAGVWVFEGLTENGLRMVTAQRKADAEGAQAAAQARLEAAL